MRRRRGGKGKDAETRWSRWGSQAAVIGVPIGLAALVLAFLALPEGGQSGSEPEAAPRLERIDLIAHNGPLPDRPALELFVHNGGRARSVISRAQLEILRIDPIRVCFTQSALGVSERYGAELPVDAKAGDLVTVPVHQQIAPDRADRFEIGLSAVGEDPMSGEDTPSIYLFEVRVSLLHDGKRAPLEMGEALVSIPELPMGSDYLLPAGTFKEVTEMFLTPNLSLREAWGRPMACWRSNAMAMMQARDSEAVRSPQLDELFRSVSLPSLSEAEP